MKNRILVLLFFFAISSSSLFAQGVVVSEYKNQGQSNQEWAELLVIQDNFSLANYKIRDNADNFNSASWQPAYIFKDVGLWKNLRAGTIIVINFGLATSTDIDASDGYIEVGVNNAIYFTPPGSGDPLNLNASNDIVEILSPSDVHVHSLSHCTLTGAKGLFYQNSIADPKANLNSSVVTGNTVTIYPGTNLAGYNGTSAAIQPGSLADNQVLGLPNFSNAGDAVNSDYWRLLRQPTWPSPIITNLEPILGGVNVYWNQADDANYMDNYQGYLIVRCDKNQVGGLTHPADGKIYAKSDAIGSGVVAGVVVGSRNTTFFDQFTMDCGITYIYRVYAYRYKADHKLDPRDVTPLTARGRQYNETNYAQSEIVKPAPAKPIINSGAPSIDLCDGDKITLSVPFVAGLTYEWKYQNMTIISNTNSYTTGAEGYYKVYVTNSFDCVDTASVIINIIQKPTLNLSINGLAVKKDTTVNLCNGAGIAALVGVADSYIWYKDNVQISTNSAINIDQPGVYFAVGANKGMCYDTSFVINVNLKEDKYSIANKTLNFNLSCQSVDTKQLTIKSLSALQNNIKISHKNSDYLVTNSYLLLANIDNNININFAPNKAGISNDTLIITGECGRKDTVFLIGKKDSAIYQKNANVFDFGTMPLCELGRDTNFIIKNTGTEIINLNTAIISPNFKVIKAGNSQISVNGSDTVRIRFEPSGSGPFTGTLKIPYSNLSCQDTIVVALIGKAYDPQLSVSPTTIHFNDLLACAQSDSTELTITNNNPAKVSIKSIKISGAAINFSTDTTGFNLDSGASQTIKVYFKPLSNSTFNASLDIAFEPCNKTLSIPLDGKKDGLVFNFAPNDIDFGDVPPCKVSSIFRDLSFNYSGTPIDSITISKISLPTGVSASVKAGDTLRNNATIRLNIIDGYNGVINGAAVIDLNSCNFSYTFNIKANVYNKYLSFSDTIIDFKNIEIDKSKTDSILLTNIGFENVKIDRIENCNAPYSYLGLSNLDFTKSEIKSLSFKYSPKDQGPIFDTIRVITSAPCVDTFRVILKGNGYYSLFKYSALLNEEIKIHPGDDVIIPIDFYLDKIEGAPKVDSIYFRLKYNATCLMPEQINGFGFNVKNKAINNKDISFTLEPINKNNVLLSPQKIVEISSQTFLGDSVISRIYFDSIKVYSDAVFLEDTIKNGWVKISNICAPGLRIILMKDALKNVVLNSANNEITAHFVSNGNTKAEIEFSDLLGNSLYKRSNIELQNGDNYLTIPTHNIGKGPIFITVRSEFYVWKEKAIIE